MIRIILMACIPKEDGDWRLVGLLPTPFRVWAASAVHIVSAWMRGLAREYIKFRGDLTRVNLRGDEKYTRRPAPDV